VRLPIPPPGLFFGYDASVACYDNSSIVFSNMISAL
jgi:hypothetical protein